MAFFLYSFALGTLFPRMGDLQLQMGLSEGELGMSLVGAPIGVQLSLLVANHVVARFSLAVQEDLIRKANLNKKL